MWGLTLAEWLTIIAIILGPFAAVATQLYVQSEKVKRDHKMWVFRTLMGLRASYVNETFVQAFNLIDVLFYDDRSIRQKRKEFLVVVDGAKGRELTNEELERCKDLISEILAKMGAKLGYAFDHTELKNTGYYPVGLMRLPTATLAVLEGRANIGIVIKEDHR